MRAVAPFLLAWMLAGCTGSRSSVKPALPHSENPAVVVGVTAVAAGAYALGGGCRIADCPHDTVCNPESERCERIECGSARPGGSPCPTGSHCSSSTRSCVPF